MTKLSNFQFLQRWPLFRNISRPQQLVTVAPAIAIAVDVVLAAVVAIVDAVKGFASVERGEGGTDILPVNFEMYSAFHPVCRKVLKMIFWEIPRLVGRYNSYLLPKLALTTF